jgi:hypothetical protein
VAVQLQRKKEKDHELEGLFSKGSRFCFEKATECRRADSG